MRAEAERLIEKERYKDAVKQAKLSFKEEASGENHRLLERAYFLRARQLLQQGMRTSAVEVAQHLLEFGVTASDSLEELVRLLMTLGFQKQAIQLQDRLGSPELKGRITELAADQLVIHPDRAGADSPERAREAGLIRQSLEKLQAGDEAGAMELLRDLPRSSPLSEWKFFVRGLAAFYRHDEAEMKTNWDRLDPKRVAFPIAERFRRLVSTAAVPDSAELEPMEKLVFGEPVLERIRQLRLSMASQEWDKVFRVLGPLRHSLRHIDPKLAERLTLVLIGSLIKSAQDMEWREAQRVVTQFTRVAQPMVIDPRWNRLWALVWDGPQADANGAIHYWVEYIKDIETIAPWNASERVLAQALVWHHLARLHNEDVGDLLDDQYDSPSSPFGPLGRGKRAKTSNDLELAAAKKEVLACVERSLELAPDYLPTYRLLVEVHEDWEDPKGVEAAAKRLLAAFPDDAETLERLSRHQFRHNDLTAALSYAQQARRSKPLDHSLRELEWTIRVGLARRYGLSKEWDAGRAEFAAAEELLPECRQQFHYLARKVIFESKAGQGERSDQFLKEARALLVEPTPLWLALTIESTRYELTPSTVSGYTKLWTADLKKKCRSETAGEMAEQLRAFVGSKIDYKGRDQHVKDVVAYLKRMTRSKFRREDIERVVEFLRLLPKEFSLREKLVKAGVKQHPDSVVMNMNAADVELTKGHIVGGTDAGQRYLEKALKIAEASTDQRDKDLLPQIRRQLGMLTELTERFHDYGFPFGGGPFGPSYYDDLDFDDDDFGDDEDDFDDDVPVFRPAPMPRPARKAAPRKTKRKKKK